MLQWVHTKQEAAECKKGVVRMQISLIFCLSVVVILMVCLVRSLILYVKLQRSHEHLAESCNQLQRLNSELRSQRHDYLNHLQVVYGMLELEEYEELKGYLEPVYKNMMKTGKAMKTSIPAVNALLMAKMGLAEQQEIDFYVEVKSDLQNLKIEPWELCKVLSNLLDNGMTALMEKGNDRRLTLEISEDRDVYLFSISNNGPMIPKEHRASIFQQGFTTKKEAGHGLGLAIVSRILRENRGSISFTSDEEETVFTVTIAKEGGFVF